MKHLEADIEIAAPPSVVWRFLLDFERYPDWNPFIIRLIGQPRLGEMLKETVLLPNGKKVEFSSKITVLEPEQRLVWEGHAVSPLLFLGRHQFLLEPSPTGTRFVQKEAVSGLLLPWIDMGANLQGYHAMNAALKARIEA